MKNFSESAKEESFIQAMFCSRFFYGTPSWSLVQYSFAGAHLLLALSAFVGNMIILVALKKESSFHPPTKLLYRVLAFTDLMVGIVVIPISATHYSSKAVENWKLCYLTGIAGYVFGVILCGVSLSVLTAISVDRLLALTLRLRYRQVATIKRVQIFLLISCVQNIMNSFLPLWNARVFVVICWVCVLLCLATSTFCYLKIYWMLRKPHVRVQVRGNLPWVQQNRTFRMSMVKFKKSVSAVLWVHVVLVACYTPFTVLNLRLSLSSDMNANSTSIIGKFFSITLVYFNSSLNPIVYCWGVTEVREIVKNMLTKFSCMSR